MATCAVPLLHQPTGRWVKRGRRRAPQWRRRTSSPVILLLFYHSSSLFVVGTIQGAGRWWGRRPEPKVTAAEQAAVPERPPSPANAVITRSPLPALAAILATLGAASATYALPRRQR